MRAFSFIIATIFATAAHAAPLTSAEREDVRAIVEEVLAASEVPSASIAIVRDGELAFTGAYGLADVANNIRATPETQYGIGSVSKQFTVAAIMLLVEQGRIDLDAPITWFDPTLPQADRITLRHLLNHTSGYPDFWAQDYPHAAMLRPIAPDAVVDGWARVGVDFEPGHEFRYSNTGYTIAALMVQRLSQQALFAFEQERIFRPLDMTGVAQINTNQPINSVGHSRWGLAPVVASVREGDGWLLGAGDLAMRASDLVRWNISLMRGGLLSAETIAAMTTTTPTTPIYGLGLIIANENGRRVWSHTGGVTGYTAGNSIYVDEGLAITVLTNGGFGAGAATILPRLALRFREQPPHIARVVAQFAAFQAGRIDRGLYTENANAFYTDSGLAELSRSLAPLGPLRGVVQQGSHMRGGYTDEIYRVAFARRSGTLVVRIDPDDQRIEEFSVYFGPP